MFHQVPTGEFLFKKIQGGHFFCLEMTTTFDDWESLQEAGGKKVRSDVLIRKIQERNATSRTWKTWIYCQWWTLKETTIPKKCGIFLPHILNFPAKFADVLYVQSMGMQGTPGWWRGRGGRRWRGRESTSRWGLVEHHRLNEMEVFWGLGMFSMKWIELHWNGKNMKVLAQIKQTLLLETDQVTDMKKLVNTWFGTRLNILETGVREVTPWILFSAKGSEKKNRGGFQEDEIKAIEAEMKEMKEDLPVGYVIWRRTKTKPLAVVGFSVRKMGRFDTWKLCFFFLSFGIVNLNITPGKQSILNTQFESLPYFTPVFVDLPKTLDKSLFFFLGIHHHPNLQTPKNPPPVLVDPTTGGPHFFFGPTSFDLSPFGRRKRSSSNVALAQDRWVKNLRCRSESSRLRHGAMMMGKATRWRRFVFFLCPWLLLCYSFF